MPKSMIYESNVLNLLLNGVGISNIAQNTTMSPLTNLYVALHSSSPGSDGNQSTNEVTYTGYYRATVPRNSGSPFWTLSGDNPVTASPTNSIPFPVSAGGVSSPITYFSIGSELNGPGIIYYYGTFTPNVTTTAGVAPVLTTSTIISEL